VRLPGDVGSQYVLSYHYCIILELNLWMQAYSIAGGVFLLIDGNYLFFTYPEWQDPFVSPSKHTCAHLPIRQIYGGVGVGIGVLAVLSILALSNVKISNFSFWSCTKLKFSTYRNRMSGPERLRLCGLLSSSLLPSAAFLCS
jgi:hypothetical protein